jgi:hypothetical protein
MVWYYYILVSFFISQNKLTKYKIRIYLKEDILYINYLALAFCNLILRMLRKYNLSLFNDRVMLLTKNYMGRMEGKRRIRRDP